MINNIIKKIVDCVIVYYIFDVLFLRKKIMREKKIIIFGEVYKFNYDLFKFEIYKVKVVV